jgi:prepilin-type N-terminal cleavage/methylation domain-containing protein
MISTKVPAEARQRKGFTLTEVAIVLGIMGLILGAIWTAASSVYANQRTAHAQTAVLQIAGGVRALYGSQASTGFGAATIITPQLNSSGVIPADLNGGTTGPFPNGATGVVATADGNGFVIAMTAVPMQNCINLIAGIAGTNRDPGLYMADAVLSAAVAAGDATTTGSPLGDEVTPTQAGLARAQSPAPGSTALNMIGGCTNTLNKIRFGFSIR